MMYNGWWMTSNLQIARALDNGWLRGAALDVFPEEPLHVQSALWNHPKVVGKLPMSYDTEFLYEALFSYHFSNPI